MSRITRLRYLLITRPETLKMAFLVISQRVANTHYIRHFHQIITQNTVVCLFNMQVHVTLI